MESTMARLPRASARFQSWQMAFAGNFAFSRRAWREQDWFLKAVECHKAGVSQLQISCAGMDGEAHSRHARTISNTHNGNVA